MKKLLSIILSVVMVLALVSSFAACGGSGSGSGSGNESVDLGDGRLSEAATDVPAGIHLSREVKDNIPKMVEVVDKYLDGEADGEATIAAINEFRTNLTFSMQQAHDIACKQNLDNIVMYIKKAMKEEAAAAEATEEEAPAEAEEGEEGEDVEEAPAEPTYEEKIIEQRNLIASYLELGDR